MGRDSSAPLGATIGADGSVQGVTVRSAVNVQGLVSSGAAGAWQTIQTYTPATPGSLVLVEVQGSAFRSVAGAGQLGFRILNPDLTAQGATIDFFFSTANAHTLCPMALFTRSNEKAELKTVQVRTQELNTGINANDVFSMRALIFPPGLS